MSTTMVGPMIETQRVIVPGTNTYVEISQDRHDGYLGYSIETGSVKYGHRGTWGRGDIRSASECFADAIAYAATHHITSKGA